jgi:dTDP-4-amino-4,6-dideoxygalactose transaminase
VKLKYLDQFNDKRRNLAKIYDEALKDSCVITPVEKDWAKHVYHLYVIRHKQRNKFQEHLLKNGIQTQIHYPVPVHKQNAYSDKYGKFELPFTEDCSKEILSLPIYPFLTEQQVREVSDCIVNY